MSGKETLIILAVMFFPYVVIVAFYIFLEWVDSANR